MKWTLLLVALPIAAAAVKSPRTEPAPIRMHDPPQRDSRFSDDDDEMRESEFENNFIVKFLEGSPEAVMQEALRRMPQDNGDGNGTKVYTTAFQGIAGKFDPRSISFLRWLPDVEYIEQDARAYAAGVVPTGAAAPGPGPGGSEPWKPSSKSFLLPGQIAWDIAPWPPAWKQAASDIFNKITSIFGWGRPFPQYLSQSDAPWGLGRITHRKNGLLDYVRHSTDAEGTCIYVIDSGIDDTHPDFEGRARQVKSFVRGSVIDDYGHGTHCAGSAASRTFGVAKKAKLYGVKVLNRVGKGSWSNVIAGLDFVSQDAPNRDCPYGTVVSVSIGGERQQSVNDAVRLLVKKGYFVAVAAGNEFLDVKDRSPASEPLACTVGASDINDKRYETSNYGSLVDIMAPGVDIVSTVPGGGTFKVSGTSHATPHVAGLAAYIAARDRRKASPDLCDRIVREGTSGAIVDQVPGTVNLLAFNNNPLI